MMMKKNKAIEEKEKSNAPRERGDHSAIYEGGELDMSEYEFVSKSVISEK